MTYNSRRFLDFYCSFKVSENVTRGWKTWELKARRLQARRADSLCSLLPAEQELEQVPDGGSPFAFGLGTGSHEDTMGCVSTTELVLCLAALLTVLQLENLDWV